MSQPSSSLVDQVTRRPVMIATDLARAALLAAIPLAWVTGTLSLGLLLVIIALLRDYLAGQRTGLR